MNTTLDHLVVVADSLDQGAAWCEATLGVAPGPGGRHALMGTHNRLLNLSSAAYPRCYLEIIAIDPDAPPPGRSRWFGMDEPALRAAVRQQPRLVHAVLRSGNVAMHRWGLVNVGQQPGTLVAAERDTPQGLLRWQICLRDDGRIGADGALPTLIEWGGRHPTDAMPASPVTLRSATLGRLPARVREVLRPRGPQLVDDGPLLAVTLDTPRGPVNLQTG